MTYFTKSLSENSTNFNLNFSLIFYGPPSIAFKSIAALLEYNSWKLRVLAIINWKKRNT